MRVRKYKKDAQTFIEFQADNRRETLLLQELFQGVGPERYYPHSQGYGRKLPGQKYWNDRAKTQALTFKLSNNYPVQIIVKEGSTKQ
jgi:hypothetical protein